MKSALYAAALAAILPAGQAVAQSPLTPVSINVARYDVLPNLRPDYGMACCALPVFESGPGQDFFYFDLDFNVAWSDELDRLSVSSRDILLHYDGADEDGQRSVARISYEPVVELTSATINARRPRDWPDENAQAFLNGIWLIPEGVTQATLVIGEEGEQFEILLNVDLPVSTMMTPLETASVDLRSLSLDDSMTRQRQVSGGSITTTLTPNIGQLLRLDLTITPTMSTDTDADSYEGAFLYYNNYFSLVGPEGVPLAPLGQDVSGSLHNDYSNSISWDDSLPSGSQRGLYFIGAGTPGTYQVYYLTDLVGEITLQ